MTLKRIFLVPAVMVLVLKTMGAGYQFIAVSNNITGLPNSSVLNAAANNGNGFVSVGDNLVCLTLNSNGFGGFLVDYSGSLTNSYLLTANAWGIGKVSTNPSYTNYTLNAVAYGGGNNNCFVASGTTNVIFTNSFPDANPASVAGSWGHAGKALSSGNFTAEGIAANSNTFVLVSDFYQSAWTNNVGGTNYWPIAGNWQTAIFESFRGVTTYGAGFALCGNNGDIRTSTNGSFWNTNQIFDFSAPNLLAIASDNANTLVAVGTNGLIKVSINAGASWTSQTKFINAAKNYTNYCFNSVACLGTNAGVNSQFIVAGNGGIVLTATATNVADWTWYVQTNLTGNVLTNNFLGASFANSTGFFQGLVTLVGDDGTVVMGGTPPQMPGGITNQVICDGSINPSLNVQIVPDSGHPANVLAVDWFYPDTNSYISQYNGMPTGLSIMPTNDIGSGSNSASVFIYYVRTRDLRTGFISPFTNISLTVNPRPTSTSVTTNTICNGTGTMLTNILTGIGPWIVSWTDGTTNYLQGVTNPAGTGGPYTNTLSIPVNDLFNPENTNLNRATTSQYWVSGVVDSTGCGSDPGDISGTNSIIINPRPTSISVATNSISCGMGAVLTNILTGIGPWIVSWTDGATNYLQGVTNPAGTGGPYTNTLFIPVNGLFNPTNIYPNQSTNYFYWVSGVVDSTGCGSDPDDISGTNMVTVYPRPMSTLWPINPLIAVNCNDGEGYYLTNVLTGIGPWTNVWSLDGQTTPQVTGVAGMAGPVTNYFEVYPTNSLGANSASNNVYFVLSVFTANMYEGNQPGDISGTNSIIINPRPTSTSVATNSISCGMGAVLTNILTGIGPWIVSWTDGATNYLQGVTNPAGTGGPYTNTLFIPVNGLFNPTNIYPNQSTNYFYWVSGVVDSTGCGSDPDDISGTNMVTVYPRPMSTLWPINPLIAVNCNDGEGYYLTNVLTGIGPWTNVWSLDGQTTPQVTGVAGMAGPVTNYFEVYPTNSLGANSASNNVYFVLSVFTANMYEGNQPGDISGTNSIIINPRPTSTSVATNAICNDGETATLTNILTGIGPWIVSWTDGVTNYMQNVTNTISTGIPYTNTLTIPNGVFVPTNAFLNQSTTNFYWVTNIFDYGTGCQSEAGDISGINQIVINPMATIAPNGFIIGTNDFYALGIKSSGGLGSANHISGNIISNNAQYYITMNKYGSPSGSSGSNELYITNHLLFTGAKPWTSVLMEVGSDFYDTTSITNYYTNTFSAYTNIFVITNLILSATSGTNFTISIYSLDNSNCSSILTTNQVSFIINGTPSVNVGIAGTGASQTTVCSDSTVTNEVDLYGGKGTWEIWWNDGLMQTNAGGAAIYRNVTVTNNAFIPIITNYWVTNLVVANLAGIRITNSLDTNSGLVEITMDPVLTNAPLVAADIITNNYYTPLTLSVGIPAGFTADWVDGTSLIYGTTNYAIPVPVNLGTNVSVTSNYYVMSRFIDTNLLDGTCDSISTNITVVWTIGGNLNIAAGQSSVPGSIVLQWLGTNILQSTTNLAPPTWMNVSTGSMININQFTNQYSSPAQFFRLWPTN